MFLSLFFFSGHIFETDYLNPALLGFILFCLTSSLVYIINDWQDIEKDKLHPKKKNRPLASGKISKTQATVLMLVLALCISYLLYIIDNKSVLMIISFYFVLNLAYTFYLKHIAIVDILIISIGFLLRVLLGGAICVIIVTEWTQLLVFSLAMVLAIGKRRGELINSELTGETRKSLDGYNIQFTDIALSIVCTITLVGYLFFSISKETIEKFHPFVFYTIIFVIAGILRYLQQTFVYNQTESPTKLVYKDRFLQIDILLWIISFALLIYFKK